MLKKKIKKASLLSQKKFFTALVNSFQLIETYRPKSTYILYISLLFYFLQLGSYISEVFLSQTNSTAALIIFRIYFYSNFVNFFHLEYLKNVKLICFICFLSINMIITIWLLLHMFIPKKIKKIFLSNKNIDEKISMLIFLYDWIIFIPALETFFNLYDCNIYAEELCSNDSIFFSFLSFINFFLTIFIRLYLHYFNRDYIFLDIKGLKEKSSVNSVMMFIARISLVIFKKINSNSEWIFLGFAILFCFFSIVFYFETFPLRNKLANKFYLSNLFSLSFFVMVVALWRVNLLSESDIFYLFIFLTILSFKLASKIYEKIYNKLLLSGNTDDNRLFSLEELCNLYYQGKLKDQANLFGIFRNHFRYCEDRKCKKLKASNFFANTIDFLHKLSMLSKFVSLHIYADLTKLRKKQAKKEVFLEELYILKFLTLTIDYDMNVIRSHFEMQKMDSETENFSLFYKVASLHLKAIIKANIKFLIYKSTAFLSSASDTTMNTDDFFRSMKIKKKLEEELIIVLQQKIKFFDSLKNGHNFFGNLLSMTILMKPKAEKLSRKISQLENMKAPYYRAIKLKFESIYEAIILNRIFEGRKLEQEMFGATGQSGGVKSLFNSEFNFLDENFITLCAGFNGYNGEIKDSSFSRKVTNFFGVGRENQRNLKDLASYMPKVVAKKHPKFIKNFINDPNRNSKVRDVGIHSYCLNGEGFIFPIKLMVGFNLDLEKEFLMNAAIKKVGHPHEKIILCQPEGNILNVSKSFFFEFQQEYHMLKLKDFEFINIFKLIPKLSEFITPWSSKSKVQKHNNLSTVLYFPSSLLKLIKSMKRSKNTIKELHKNHLANLILKDPTPLSSNQTKHTVKSDLQDETFSEKNELREETQTYNSKAKDFALYDEGIIKQANINFNLYLYKYSVDADTKIDFFTLHIVDLNYFEATTFEKEETGLIQDTTEQQNIVLPLENQPKIINLFARRKNEVDTPLKENNEVFRNEKENVFKKLKVDNEKNGTEATIEKKIVKKTEKKGKTVMRSEMMMQIDVNQNRSQHSSTQSGNNRALVLYKSMEEIEKLDPRPLKNIIILTIFQMIMAFLYFVISFLLSKDYFANFYEPYEFGLKSFCHQYTGLGTAMILNIESEYLKLGLASSMESDDLIQLNKFYEKVLNKSIFDIEKAYHFFIDSNNDLNFQKNYKILKLKNIDPIKFKIKTMYFVDFILDSMSTLNSNLENFKKNDSDTINYDRVIFLQRNSPYFLIVSKTFYDSSKDEFLHSGDNLVSKVVKMLIFFVIAAAFIKTMEVILWCGFENMLKQIMQIFQRCKEPEILRTLDSCTEILKSINNSNDYFYNNYSEELIEKSSVRETDAYDKSPKKAKKSKNDHNNERKVKREFTHLLSYFFIMVVFVFLYFYYIFIYFKFYSNNQSLQALNKLDFLFMDLNVFTTSIVSFYTLAFREITIDNPDYEGAGEIYQSKQGRLKYFTTSLNTRLSILSNLTSTSLLEAQLDARDKLPDNLILKRILKEDLCQILIEVKEFEAGSYEHKKCEKVLDGALRNGIINAQSEFIKGMKLREIDYLSGVMDLNQEDMDNLIDRVMGAILDETYHDFLFGTYYLHILEEFLYDNINEYYTTLLFNLVNSLEVYLGAFIAVALILSVILIVFIRTNMKNRFSSFAFIISLIPCERLFTDEQLVFLIKNFLKTHR